MEVVAIMFPMLLHLSWILYMFRCVFADWSLFSDLDDPDALNDWNDQDYLDDFGSSSYLDPDFAAIIFESDASSSWLEPDFSAFIPESDSPEMIPASDYLESLFPSEYPEMIPDDLSPVESFTSCPDENIGQVSKLKPRNSVCPIPDEPSVNVPQFPNMINSIHPYYGSPPPVRDSNRVQSKTEESDNICTSSKYRKNVTGRDTPLPVCGSENIAANIRPQPGSWGSQIAGYYDSLEFCTLSKSI